MNHFELNRPVFVRSRHYPIIFRKQTYTHNTLFPWRELGIEEDEARILFQSDQIYHNEELEVKGKVGDRLAELSGTRLKSLVNLTNAMIKKRCTTDKEFQSKKVKGSLIDDKQRALVRAWINRNHWALEEYQEIRDKLLDET